MSGEEGSCVKPLVYNHKTEQYEHRDYRLALEVIDPKVYQMLVRRAVKNPKWAEYFLLLDGCCAVLRDAPTTEKEYDEADLDKLIERGLEHLGNLIPYLLPGGPEEFYHYMPQDVREKSG